MNETTNYKTYKELAKDLIDKLNEKKGYADDLYTDDLHNELYNTDYFIIRYYQAEEWLKEYAGVFAAIEVIKDYEQDNFGEVNTDLSSSEKVVNMFVYIIGEELLYNLKSFDTNKKYMSDEMIDAMIKELEEEYPE